jgi:aspartyl-tRNA(Asn)/glutamyl-tRNA(Gln) amidotransferase subunit A
LARQTQAAQEISDCHGSLTKPAMPDNQYALKAKPDTRATVCSLAADLAAGRTSSRALVEQALARIADPDGEGSRTFLKVYAEEARLAADGQDRMRKAGYIASPLAGLPVSVKDLFDIAGDRTRAGSKALADAPPAARDAVVVARLRAAGAVLIGRTNMTEFAFSGVGINPHYGTPGNPFDRARIPGGSSSGAAVSVSDGFAALAVGTDTGGSVRIPAAFCGLVGFKPTQRRISRDGVTPLSPTLDSIGPLANSVSCCAIADAVMAGEDPQVPDAATAPGLRLGVPQSFVLDHLDPHVAESFARSLSALSRSGARLVDLPLTELLDYPVITSKGSFAPAEAYSWHAELLARRAADYDPWVRSRIERGRAMTAPEYVTLCAERRTFVARVAARTAELDALLMPTVPLVAPRIAEFATDEDFARLNGRILRNTSLVNFLDGCAVTLPIARPSEAPVGLMVVGQSGQDRRLLAIARALETILESE